MTDSPTARELSPEEQALMKPLNKMVENLLFAQMVAPTTSNAIGSTLCAAAVRSIALAIMMSEHRDGTDIQLRGKQLDFLLLQMAEAYTREIALIEQNMTGFKKAVNAALDGLIGEPRK